jgi:Carboxypeptidase regulatory-like domain
MQGKSNTIPGVVRDPRGRPISQARVYFTAGPVPLADIAALTNEQGEFSLSAPADGNYQLECAADGFSLASRKAVIKSSKETTLEIKLEPKTS